jgi:type IV secretory pathway TraG/TraD family ATPase VirD4
MTVLEELLARIHAVSRAAGDGIYLGGDLTKPVWAAAERAALVLGPPRSGKTTSIIIPAVLAATGPVVSTSTKPDVMRMTAGMRSLTGETLLYDPSGTVERPKVVTPLAWSPVAPCSSWDSALLIARLMTVVSTGGGSPSRPLAGGIDNHWHERADALLAPLLHAAALDGAPMSTVIKWVDRHQAGPAQSILDNAGSEKAADILGGIATTESRELSGIWSTASGVLGAYRSDAAIASTIGPQFDAQAWNWGRRGPFTYVRPLVIKLSYLLW